MSTPAIVILILTAMSGTLYMVQHGKPRDNYNFGWWLLSAGIELGILYWGGFFS